jgi:hypothetical protein
MNPNYAATAQSLTDLAEALEAEAKEYRDTATRLLKRGGLDASAPPKNESSNGTRAQSFSMRDPSLGLLTADSLHAHLQNKGGRPSHIAERFGVSEGDVKSLVSAYPRKFAYIERGYLRALDLQGHVIQPQASGATE